MALDGFSQYLPTLKIGEEIFYLEGFCIFMLYSWLFPAEDSSNAWCIPHKLFFAQLKINVEWKSFSDSFAAIPVIGENLFPKDTHKKFQDKALFGLALVDKIFARWEYWSVWHDRWKEDS